MVFFLIITGLSVAVFLAFSLRSHMRRKQFFDAPFPEIWEKILRKNVPIYSRLPEDLLPKFHRRIKEFLSEKTFEACGELKTVSDEMAVTIAGTASLLSVNRSGNAWRALHSVLVYPKAFSSPDEESETDTGLITREHSSRDGESWTYGSVVFSWQRITRDIALHGNGQNVIIHEFAHQLDSDDGIAGGRPMFTDAVDQLSWKKISARELERLREGDSETIIDEYGAENPADFFATSVEAFFEKPEAMKHAHPELYAILTRLFRLDPAAWDSHTN